MELLNNHKSNGMTNNNSNEQVLQLLRDHLKAYPDFPKDGVLFRDVFSLLQVPKVFAALRDLICDHVRKLPEVNYVGALDARGFIFGTIIALEFNIPFIPLRKKGKLAGKVATINYQLEYGDDTLEIQLDSIKPGSKVLLVDDLLALGGTLEAATKLIHLVGAEVIECLVIVELVNLKGRKRLKSPVYSFLQY